MKEKFPIKIILGKEQNRRFIAATSIDKFNGRTKNIRQELSYFELDYTILTKTICDLISSKSKDPRLYWLAGDSILNFLNRTDELGFYLERQNHTLARDIGISESSIKKIVSFRRRFPKLSTVNPSISWAKYRNNKVV